MARVRYSGRPPNSDSSITTKSYIDTRYGQVAVSNDVIDQEVAAAGVGLVTKTYVDTQDNTRAKRAAVTAADNNYVPVLQRGAANGVAATDVGNYVPNTMLPALVLDRPHSFVDASAVFLSGEVTTTTTDSKEFQAATLVINDPGFAYHPLLFATVAGRVPLPFDGILRKGGGSYGKMSILRADDTVWGGGATTGAKGLAVYQAHPYCAPGATPLTVNPMEGTNTFGLWLACWSGPQFLWSPVGFSFFAMVFPAA